MRAPALLGMQLGVPRAVSPLELAAPQRVLELGDARLHKSMGGAQGCGRGGGGGGGGGQKGAEGAAGRAVRTRV